MKTIKSSVKRLAYLYSKLQSEGFEVTDESSYSFDYPFIKYTAKIPAMNITVDMYCEKNNVSLDINYLSVDKAVHISDVDENESLDIIKNIPLFTFSNGNKFDALFSYKGYKFSLVPNLFGYNGRGIMIDLYLLDGLKKTFITHLSTVEKDSDCWSGAEITYSDSVNNTSATRGIAVKYVEEYLKMIKSI